MERLTKRNEDGSISLKFDCQEGCKYLTCSMEEGYQCKHQCEGDIICKLADYEDAEEQGLLLKLPCKVGDTIYDCTEYFNGTPCPEMYIEKVTHISISKNDNGDFVYCIGCNDYSFSDFGEIVFLSQEEAEQALKKLESEG